jgi:hypothetical protein
VTPLLADLFKTCGFKSALDLAKTERAKPPQPPPSIWRTFGGWVAIGGSKCYSSASRKFARASSSVRPWLATSTSRHWETNHFPFAPDGGSKRTRHDTILPQGREARLTFRIRWDGAQSTCFRVSDDPPGAGRTLPRSAFGANSRITTIRQNSGWKWRQRPSRFLVTIGPGYQVRFFHRAVGETGGEWRVRYLMMGLAG